MFMEAKIKEFQNVKDSVVIFDRGPEDIEFYTLLSNDYRRRVGYRN